MGNNIPEVKLGVIAVSRDCFVISLSERRRAAVKDACTQKGIDLFEAKTTVENETDMQKAVAEVTAAGCNALLVFLGNFGPETPETLIAKYFDGPVMYAAAAEETGKDLINGRGDAYCGMLNCSYNLGLRNLKAYIPEYPVGTAEEIADMIADFVPVARVLIGLANLKIITFGPRPQDFFACNAPIKPLYDLGVEIQENSELDLLVAYRAHENDPRIGDVVKDMADELGMEGNQYPDLLPRMAQFELTLLDWAEENKGARKYVAFADKCWPAFPKEFGFEPCYVNSRLASRGIPVACEVDIYGALSEYIGACITGDAVTLLDINNSVPRDIYEEDIKGKFDYTLKDTFMGFHCGNTPFCKLAKGAAVKYQLIQNRLLENGGTPDFTRGTLEGDIAAGQITFYRLHGAADGTLHSYIAQGEILPVATRSFGGIGVFAIPEMGRFYRHVLIEKHYPHHGAVAFGHVGKALFSIFDYLGVKDIAFNQPKGMLYPTENPFAE
ncbi:L-fucose/L-arabinose isomerase family protein [Christensenella intestinihominis]|uniref:L-fucose/L-arabinose isomerase family protein n=1 Tax=Christensenella intestinihominis TaxID=1851429 RepID=UPI0008322A19|nr:fucose isomerase [Christensenella intestinihominis]